MGVWHQEFGTGEKHLSAGGSALGKREGQIQNEKQPLPLAHLPPQASAVPLLGS